MAPSPTSDDDPHAFDAKLAKALERDYQTPEIVEQRRRTIAILNPKAGDRIMDVGCGPGLLALEMAPHVGANGHITGIDTSPDMLRLAADRCAAHPNITVTGGNALALPVGDRTLDAMSCTQVLLLIADVPAALREFHRVLKPGGRLVVVETDWRGAVVNTADKDLTHRMFEAWDDMAVSPNLPARLAPLLTAAGFQTRAVTPVPILNRAFTPERFSYSYMRGLARHAAGRGDVSPEDAAWWIADLEQKDRDGAYFFCVNRFVFLAEKT